MQIKKKKSDDHPAIKIQILDKPNSPNNPQTPKDSYFRGRRKPQSLETMVRTRHRRRRNNQIINANNRSRRLPNPRIQNPINPILPIVPIQQTLLIKPKTRGEFKSRRAAGEPLEQPAVVGLREAVVDLPIAVLAEKEVVGGAEDGAGVGAAGVAEEVALVFGEEGVV